MVDPVRVFLSYQKSSSSDEVMRLEHFLSQALDPATGQRRYAVWRDKELLPGENWAEVIGLNLHKSDVLIVLIGQDTPSSLWVRKEISLARRFNIAVLPAGHGIDRPRLLAHTRALGLDEKQFVDLEKYLTSFSDVNSAMVLERLSGGIQRCQQITLQQQADFVERQMKAVKTKAESKAKKKSFTLGTATGIYRLHVATGDISDILDDIHVIVNSENNYMQMARIFERSSVSSNLRYLGAKTAPVFQDTIQEEINKRLKKRSRPVTAAEVVVTGAGMLTKRGVRQIFHVAAVQAVLGSKAFVPLKQADEIQECVWRCLEELQELNGSVAANNPLKSILFPLFGTGEGGEDRIEHVVDPMIETIRKYLDAHLSHLSDIYLSVFHQDDVDIVVNRLKEKTYLQTGP